MISSIIDAVLITALVVTSTCVLLMYRRLKRFDVLQGEAASAFASASKALEQARLALHNLQSEGDVMAVALASRLNEARSMLNELDATLVDQSALMASQAPPAAPPAPVSQAPIKAPPSQAPRTLHVSADTADTTGQGAIPGTVPWTPPAAKIRVAASQNRARKQAVATQSPEETWSNLSPTGGVPTAH